MSAPERIWAWPKESPSYCMEDEPTQRDATEYIRADLAPAPSWQPIETAPKGEWVERRAGKEGTARLHVPKRIIALMSNGDWTVSYWIESAQRWNMFTKANPPLGWCLPPPAQDSALAQEGE